MKHIVTWIILVTGLGVLQAQRFAHLLTVKLPTQANNVSLHAYYKGENIPIRDGCALLYDTEPQYNFIIVIAPPRAISIHNNGTLAHLVRDKKEPCAWYTATWNSETQEWEIEQRTERLPARLPDHACVILCHPRYIASLATPTQKSRGKNVLHLPQLIFKQRLSTDELQAFHAEILEATIGIALDMNTQHAAPLHTQRKHAKAVQVKR